MEQISPFTCVNIECLKFNTSKSDGTNCDKYYKQDIQACASFLNKPAKNGAQNMLKTAKNISTSIHATIKPYEKYIGLVVLAVVIDHFFLDSKFASRFKSLAEAIVDKITGTLASVINKLTDGVIESVDGEDK